VVLERLSRDGAPSCCHRCHGRNRAADGRRRRRYADISGNSHAVVALEAEVADLHHKEAALAFSSGYVSNEAALGTIGRLLPNCLILSDEKNHASMIVGIRASEAEKRIFRHMISVISKHCCGRQGSSAPSSLPLKHCTRWMEISRRLGASAIWR
jgi:hypothetical protein